MDINHSKHDKKFLSLLLKILSKIYVLLYNNKEILLVLVTALLFFATAWMAFETKEMAKATRDMAKTNSLHVEYLLRKDSQLSIRLDLDIYIDSTKVIQNEIIDGNAILLGRDFKKYYDHFQYSIRIKNESYITLKNGFQVFIVINQYDEIKNKFVDIDKQPYLVESYPNLAPGGSICYDDSTDNISNSGALDVNIADNAKILIKIFAVFDEIEGFFTPAQISVTNLIRKRTISNN